MSNTLYPKRQPEFATWLDHLATALAGDPESYGATAAQSDRLAAANVAFQAAWAVASDPATRTRSAVAGKDTALQLARREAKNIADIIRAAPTVTPGQLADLGFPQRGERARSKPPESLARLRLLSTGPNSVRVRVFASDSAQPHPKPVGAIGCVVMIHIGETAPTDYNTWSLAAMTSKSVCEIVLPAAIEPGSKVWIVARFVNRKLEQGPPTEPPMQIRVAGHLCAERAPVKLAA